MYTCGSDTLIRVPFCFSCEHGPHTDSYIIGFALLFGVDHRCVFLWAVRTPRLLIRSPPPLKNPPPVGGRIRPSSSNCSTEFVGFWILPNCFADSLGFRDSADLFYRLVAVSGIRGHEGVLDPSIRVLRWETTRLNLQGPRHEVPTLFPYNLHEGRYLRSLEWQG